MALCERCPSPKMNVVKCKNYAMPCLGNNNYASISHLITSDGLFIHCKLICLQQQNLVDIYYDGILGLGQNGPETYHEGIEFERVKYLHLPGR